ncbi:hypothetical protein [Paenibacillus sp. MMS18-CY102]|uniref:hypothetical protein n=1 Tax=Paenibacillus sp. MMS18-CY102 TaxID=2682849 RepID=UPI0013654CBA|nr:hypothetical protein [Paenibacillus sp. MMS18-CY102]MWC30250.1 hypothetical protein [Paenibacillus sp. MMS18-CY102]
MIDRRNAKTFNHEAESGLKEVSDTAILLNFSNALTSLYPHLVPIHANAYDAWDDIVEPLFHEMVYQTFAFKYGLSLSRSQVHTYGVTLRSYRGICHIECTPKSYPLAVFKNHEWVQTDEFFFEGKPMIFKSFGDGVNFLSGGIMIGARSEVHFNLVEIELIATGPIETLYISKEDLNFAFVAEDKA